MSDKNTKEKQVMSENDDVLENESTLTGGDDQILDINSDLIRGHINTII